jgi:hypothetical protein
MHPDVTRGYCDLCQDDWHSSSVSEVTLPGIDYPNEVLCGFLESLLVHILLILLDAS